MTKYTYSKSGNSFQKQIFLLLVTYFLLSTIMPFVSQVIGPYIYLSAVILIYLGVIFRNKDSFSNIFMFLLPFLGVILLELFCVFVYQGDVLMFMYNNLLQLLPPVLCFFLLLTNHRKSIKWILFVTVVAFLVTAITSYFGLKNDMEAARWLATVDDSKNPYFISLNLKNIGGYSTVYGVVLILPMLICLYKQKKIKGYMFYPMVIVFFLFLINAQYTTALILFFYSFILLFLPASINKKNMKNFILVAIIIVLIIRPLLGNLFYTLAQNTKSNSISSRLQVVGDILIGKENTTEANTRVPLITYDINIFLENPLIGSSAYDNGINSGHSFTLDILAKFGVVGGVALIFMYRQIYKKLYLPFRDTEYYGYMIFSFLEVVILSTVNTGNFFLILTFVTPLIGYVMQNKNYKLIRGGAILHEDSLDN